jgi:hypothetical protein
MKNIKEEEYKRVSALIERYFDGETSTQEETFLKNYFAEQEVDASLERYGIYFKSMKQWAKNRSEIRYPEILPTNQDVTNRHRSTMRNKYWRWGMTSVGIAASLIAIFFIAHDYYSSDYLIIDGKMSKNSAQLQEAIQKSFENVKIDNSDFLNILNNDDNEKK